MLAQLRIKLKNAECAVAFLQTQHAKTLEGLHHEIQKLQQQNASAWPLRQYFAYPIVFKLFFFFFSCVCARRTNV